MAAHLVNCMFSLLRIFVALVVSNFGFEDRTLVLIASVPCHCLPFTLLPARIKKIQSKTKALEWPKQFSNYKYMVIFPDTQGQLTLIPDFMVFQNEEDSMKNNKWDRVAST